MPSGSLAMTPAEKLFSRHACRYTGEEWRRRIDMITDFETKLITSNIIWWDYFADKSSEVRWDHLDDLRREYNKMFKPTTARIPSLEKLEAGLIAVGYPASRARSRSKFKRGTKVAIL